MVRRFTSIGFCIWFVMLLVSFSSFGQTASFSLDDTAGCAPLVVHMTNTTGCTSCTYSWDLGNGGTSTLTDVSGSYTSPGTYTISLTATNGSISSTTVKRVTVYPQPTVNFSAT